MGDRE
jgi:hypothetical protein